jgi:hypothetical protein
MTVTYTIHKSSPGVIDAPAATSSLADSNTIRRGSQATITFRDPLSRLTIAAGETITVPTGESEKFDFVVIDDGGELIVDGSLAADELTNNGTLTLNGTLTVSERVALEFEDLRRYREYAGQASITETIDGTQRFIEMIDENAIDTLVVGIEPDQQARNDGIPGVWGVVERITDDRNQPLTTNAITVELRVLAPYEEYSSVADVTSTLKIN